MELKNCNFWKIAVFAWLDHFRRQFHQCFLRIFLYKRRFGSFFSSYVYVEKAAKTTFVQKRCAFNIDEIDTWCGMNSNDNKNLDVFFKNQNKETKKYVMSTVRVVYQMALTGPKLICFWHLEIILIETTTLDLRDVMDNHN